MTKNVTNQIFQRLYYLNSTLETGEEKGQLEAAEGPSEKDLKTTDSPAAAASTSEAAAVVKAATPIIQESKEQQEVEQEQPLQPLQQPQQPQVKSVSFLPTPQQTPLMYSRSSTPESLNR